MFAATDGQGWEYALKRLLAADKEAADGILKEIRFLRSAFLPHMRGRWGEEAD